MTPESDKGSSAKSIVENPPVDYGPNAVRGENGGISCRVCGLSIHSCGGFHPNAEGTGPSNEIRKEGSL